METKGIFGFKLDEVKGKDAYIENALEKELAYLKSFDADRLVAGFREVNKLRPKSEKYPGWEVTEIRGHSLGHYLTAAAQGVAQTGDAQLKENLDYIVAELAVSQLNSGYLSAFPEVLFDNVENKKPCWVPWYTMDKIIAGLTSVYVLTGNEQALQVVSRLGDWVYERTARWTKETQETVLAVEYGGMNETMYDLYRVTGKKEHALAAHKFDEMPLFEALFEGKDILNGKHANTTIPKFLGAIYRYTALGCRTEDEFYLEAVKKFWDIVVSNHTYITGGNSEWEHFGESRILDAERTNCNCVTCNTYNMLKLSRELFCITGEKKYLDFYENTFVNAILSSQNPETGMTMYFQPMATGYFKVYSTPFDSFWCCTGTGMENFTKCNDSIYFHDEDVVYVSQYISSELNWKEKGFALVQESGLPEAGSSNFKIVRGSAKLALRVPDWAAGEMTVTVNGQERKQSGGFVVLEVAEQDEIRVEIPMEVRAYPLPDNAHCIGLKYGPVVLSADLGTEDMEESKTGVDVTIATKNISIKDFITVKAADGGDYSTDADVENWIADIRNHVVKADGKLEFSLCGTDSDKLVFTPHYRRYKERYGIYWNMVAKDSKALQEHIREGKMEKRIENVLIDSIPLGNDQYELLHHIQGENTGAGTFNGQMLRHAWSKDGWFSYEMKVNPQVNNYLMVKYFSGNVGRTFNILIDGTLLKEETIQDRNPGNFYEEYYKLPQELIAGKKSVCVRFEVRGDSWVGGIFDKLNIVSDYPDVTGIEKLEISGGELQPAFEKDITEYTLSTQGNRIVWQAELSDKDGLLYCNDILVDDAQKREEKVQSGQKLVLKTVAQDDVTEKKYTIVMEVL